MSVILFFDVLSFAVFDGSDGTFVNRSPMQQNDAKSLVIAGFEQHSRLIV